MSIVLFCKKYNQAFLFDACVQKHCLSKNCLASRIQEREVDLKETVLERITNLHSLEAAIKNNKTRTDLTTKKQPIQI